MPEFLPVLNKPSVWRWAVIAVLLLAALLRFWDLESKPPHFDEGINGWFADGMKNTGFYDYDPSNYHGPLHFYAVYLSQSLFGRSLFALRLPAVLPAIGIVGAFFLFRPFFGRPAVLIAALLAAVSPALVFYGRYSIHESWMTLANMMFFAGFLGLWKLGDLRSLLWCLAGVTGMILSKETWIIQIGTLALTVPCFLLWQKVVPVEVPRIAGRQWKPSQLFAAGAVCCFVILFFFSGTFYNWSGVAGLWETYALWMKTGMESGGHEKAAYDLIGPLNWYWIMLLARYEWPSLLGLAACVACVGKVAPLLRFSAIYGCGLLLAYTVVAYKTPWCILAFCWVFFLVGPAYILALPSLARSIALALLAIAAVGSSWKTVDLNFFRPTDDREPYVYVQTYPEIERFTGPLLRAARNDSTRYAMGGEILTESYFPLPWILGDFTRVGYFGSGKWPERLNGDFILVDTARLEEARKLLQGEYWEVELRIRGGQEPVTALFRKSVFSAGDVGLSETEPSK